MQRRIAHIVQTSETRGLMQMPEMHTHVCTLGSGYAAISRNSAVDN
jgi:hypothetical protein